jgi:hypothetical protein
MNAILVFDNLWVMESLGMVVLDHGIAIISKAHPVV